MDPGLGPAGSSSSLWPTMCLCCGMFAPSVLRELGKYPGASRVSGISVKKTQIHAEMDRNEQPWWVGVGVSPPVRCPVSAERGQTGPGGGRRVPWGGRPLPWCLALTSFPLS